MEQSPTLSIIFIARNEEKNIRRSIESVLKIKENWPKSEIFLIDSASTDATVEIARQYPVNILRLNKDWPLTASAGRYMGTCYTRGELILFLDGDMEFNIAWLDQAVPLLAVQPDIAGVAGYRRDVYMENGQVVGEEDFLCDAHNHMVEVRDFGGAALYRRSALSQVGGFNPYLISEEEPELCIRLRHAGYRLVCLPELICRHYCVSTHSLDGLLRRGRLNYYAGHGQASRYHWGTPIFWMYQRERGPYWVYLAGVMMTVVALIVGLLLHQATVICGWLLLVAMVPLAYWIRRRSLRDALLMTFVQHTLVAIGAVRGFLMPPKDPATYPTEVEVVQVMGHLGGLRNNA
jgi:glycosyltransferase involved in cell wall biosynthesis